VTPALVACGVWLAASRIVHLGAGLASLRIAWNESHASTAFDAVSLDAHRPVSLLVPAAGADPSALLETIRSLSSIGSVDVEIVVAVRERDDGVRAALAAEWALEDAPSPAATRAPDARLLRSRLHERIVVAIAPEGRTLSTALALARSPLVCVVLPGATIEPKALLRAATMFTEREHVVAVAGGALPSREDGVLDRLQSAAYARAFFAGGIARAAFRARLGDGAPFHLLHRESLLRAGGYDDAAPDPHLDALLRMSKRLRAEGLPFRTLVAMEPLGRTPLPATALARIASLARARRGLRHALVRHRDALLRRRYGALGWISLPWLACFAWAAPAWEIGGALLLGASVVSGRVPPDVALLALGGAVAQGALRWTIALAARGLSRGPGAERQSGRQMPRPAL